MSAICWNLLGHLFGKLMEITGLKAPGNYDDQFWSNKVSVLLLERPKSQNPMISGLLDPWDPLIYTGEYKKIWEQF